VQRVGRDRSPAAITSTGPLHAHLDGFDLHAAVAVPAGDRKRLEHLCRYVLRPPIAQERLERAPDGAVVLRLRRPWTDGTRAIRFEPSEFLEKLASLVPKPRINLLVYHGAFAPHAHGRKDAVRASAGSLWSAGRAHEGAARGAAPPDTGDRVSSAPAAAPAAEPVWWRPGHAAATATTCRLCPAQILYVGLVAGADVRHRRSGVPGVWRPAAVDHDDYRRARDRQDSSPPGPAD
jgi:hypothetical protein